MDNYQLDEAKAGAFAQQMLGVLNAGPLALMTSVGHRTRLFDTMAILPAATSHQVAAAAGLQERYVREWLGAMVTGRVVEYDPAYATYRLPPEHAAFLTRSASPRNFAVTAQFVGLLGGVEDAVVQAFEQGGGVPYASYHRFHEIMAEASGQNVVTALVEKVLPLSPGLTAALEQGINVLDLGCGRGRALLLLAGRFPNSRFTGYDFAADVIATAQEEAEQKGLTNIHFAARDAATLEQPARYDLICTFDAIHDQADPARVLHNIYTALRPGGLYLMQEIAGSSELQNNLDHPLGTLLYTVSCMHCMTVSLSQNGAGLGTMWGKELALSMLAEAGFEDLQVHEIENDIVNYYCFATKPA